MKHVSDTRKPYWLSDRKKALGSFASLLTIVCGLLYASPAATTILDQWFISLGLGPALAPHFTKISLAVVTMVFWGLFNKTRTLFWLWRYPSTFIYTFQRTADNGDRIQVVGTFTLRRNPTSGLSGKGQSYDWTNGTLNRGSRVGWHSMVVDGLDQKDKLSHLCFILYQVEGTSKRNYTQGLLMFDHNSGFANTVVPKKPHPKQLLRKVWSWIRSCFEPSKDCYTGSMQAVDADIPLEWAYAEKVGRRLSEEQKADLLSQYGDGLCRKYAELAPNLTT